MSGNRRKLDEPVAVELPITPMLDMSFQLMAFFILTFRPQPQEGQMSLFLPALDTGPPQGEPPPFLPDEKPDQYTVRVTDSLGDIGHITLKAPSGVEEVGGANSLPILMEKLKAIGRAPGKKGPNLKIESSDGLKYSKLIQIMDVCMKAGFESVGVSPITKQGGGAGPVATE